MSHQIQSYSIRQEALRYLLTRNPVDRYRAVDRILEVVQAIGAVGRIMVLVQHSDGCVTVTANRVRILSMDREETLLSANILINSGGWFLPLAILEGTYASSFSATTQFTNHARQKN